MFNSKNGLFAADEQKGYHKDIDYTTAYLKKQYKDRVQNLLFDGIYLDGNSLPLMIGQTNKERELLESGLLVAEVYMPFQNTKIPIIGNYSKTSINAFSIGNNNGAQNRRIESLKKSVLDKELDIKLEFLVEDIRVSYSLTSVEKGGWKGIEKVYGINIGARLTEPGHKKTNFFVYEA